MCDVPLMLLSSEDVTSRHENVLIEGMIFSVFKASLKSFLE